jgi:competence protein ComEC
VLARADCRLAVLAGLAAGLAASPLTAGSSVSPALPAAAALALAATRPRRSGARPLWLLLVAAVAACAGLLAGGARLAAIDGGALHGTTGAPRALRGFVAAVPRRSGGEVRIQVDTEAGRVLVQTREPVADLPLGAEVSAAGVLTAPPSWYRGTLRRQGIAMVLRAPRVDLTGARRGGLRGALDRVRGRAEDALGRGMPPREAALARGFVLGQDDRIDERTVEDFRRSGLAHLLAVSGQNVVLLALLAAPLLALLGVPLRARLVWLSALIAFYVPLAGAGPSIQRAGVMGLAALLATLAGRPASRLYGLLLAAAATLALNPRASGDPGWQLSFAAVAGIFLLAAPLRRAFAGEGGGLRRAAAEGAAVTVAATIATAPLMAEHFGAVSLSSVAANLLALPAVAPAMWLGMIAAAAGQVPGLPLEPLNGLNALLLAYIAQVAAWLGRPGWASAEVDLGGAPGLAATYAVLALITVAGLSRRAARRLRPRSSARPRRWALGAAAIAAAAIALLAGGPAAPGRPAVAGLRVEVLDVGQGDAILLQPPHAGAVLVDGGPPGAGVAGMLRESGAGELAAAIVTHDQSDHAGGIREMLGEVPVHRLLYAWAGHALLDQARAAGAVPLRVAEGSEVRSGALRVEVLWPPRVLLSGPAPADPNQLSLVLLARWRGFSMLLTGDAEAESVPIDPGPVDVLKVAHHGSEDAGLAELLERSSPRLAVISVGEDNPFGHPAPATVATLAEHGVPVLRTDRDGTAVLEAGRGRLRAGGD